MSGSRCLPQRVIHLQLPGLLYQVAVLESGHRDCELDSKPPKGAENVDPLYSCCNRLVYSCWTGLCVGFLNDN